MDEQFRKRLEEAAKASWHERYPDGVELYKDAQIDGFKAGAEHGYKEAIAQAKEWLRYNVHRYIYAVNKDGIPQAGIGAANFSDDFEADMNKLWEESK